MHNNERVCVCVCVQWRARLAEAVLQFLDNLVEPDKAGRVTAIVTAFRIVSVAKFESR